MSAALASLVRFKLRELGRRLLSSIPGDGVPPPKPGSAADLLEFFQGEQKTWSRSKSVPKIRKRIKTGPMDRFRTDAYRLPSFFSALSGQEKELTRRALNAVSRAEFSFRAGVSRTTILQEAGEAVKELREVASAPLSPVTLSLIIRRAARLADNPTLRPTKTETRSTVDVGQGELLSELAIKGLLALQEREASRSAKERENRNARSSASSPTVLGYSTGNEEIAVGTNFEECAWEAEMASSILFSSALIFLRLPKQDIDLLATILLREKSNWQSREVVMMVNALGRLGALPLEGEFHTALRDDASWHFLSLDPPTITYSEMSTILRAFAQSGYHPGDQFLYNVVGKLHTHLDQIKPSEAGPILYALSRFSYAPHCGVPLKHHRTWRWEVRDSLRALRASENIMQGTQSAVNNNNNNYQTATATTTMAGKSGEAHSHSEERVDDMDLINTRYQHQDQNPMRFRSLRELQAAAREWEARRRQSISQSFRAQSSTGLTTEDKRDGAGNIPLWGFSDIDTTLYDSGSSESASVGLAALVQRTAAVRAERAEAERLVHDADAILRSMRLKYGTKEGGGIEKKHQEAQIPGVSFIRNQNDTSRSTTITNIDEHGPDAEQLVHRLLTGAWPAEAEKEDGKKENSKSSMSGGRGRHVLRLGKMIAEARVQPESGRTLISPLYEPSLLYDSVEPDAEPPLLSVLDATFPLDAAAMRLISDPDGGAGFGKFGDLPLDAGEIAAEVIGALLRKAVHITQEARPERILVLPKCMGYLRYWDPEILAMIAQRIEALPSLDSVRPHSLLEVVWTFAYLNEPMPQELLKRLVDHLIAVPPQGRVDYARLMWCLAAMGQLDVDMYRILGDKFVQVLEAHPGSYDYIASSGALSQMFQAALHLEATTGVPHEDILPEQTREAAAAVWKDRSSTLTTSMTQHDVADVLRTLGVRCELEYAPPGTHVIIDIAATLPGGAKLAVEVDGPFHFASNVKDKPMGARGLRNALLEHSGWHVVSVPLYEFGDLKSLEEEQEYLRERVVRPLEQQLKELEDQREREQATAMPV